MNCLILSDQKCKRQREFGNGFSLLLYEVFRRNRPSVLFYRKFMKIKIAVWYNDFINDGVDGGRRYEDR